MTDSIWPNDDQTTTLLKAARAGDADAVNRLLDKHRSPVRRLIEMRLDRKVRRRVDVSDVVQEVMVDASTRLKKYLDDPAMAFHLWLRQIASDRIIDTYRRHRVSAKRDMDREQPMIVAGGPDQSAIDLIAALSDPALTPAAAATNRELAGQVESAIEQLEPQHREIILMRHYERLTNQEIAEVLGLTSPAASMRYLRAVRRLRLLLDPAADQGPSS
jgi:RNA polymerase sigma-70 factor (ECF subfamily)